MINEIIVLEVISEQIVYNHAIDNIIMADYVKDLKKEGKNMFMYKLSGQRREGD